MFFCPPSFGALGGCDESLSTVDAAEESETSLVSLKKHNFKLQFLQHFHAEDYYQTTRRVTA